MSLVAIAIRTCIVEALLNRTDVGANVQDSPIGGIKVDADGQISAMDKDPFIAVYTDASQVVDISGPMAVTENHSLTTVIEWGISSAMGEIDAETGETRLFGQAFAATSAAYEFRLDMIARQLLDALVDPENEWSELFRGFQHKASEVRRIRTSNDQDTVKLAGHQLSIVANYIDDPVMGQEIPLPFQAFFAACDASGEPLLIARKQMIEGHLTGERLDIKVLQAQLGLTDAETLALGLGPLTPDSGDLDQVDIEGPLGIETVVSGPE